MAKTVTVSLYAYVLEPRVSVYSRLLPALQDVFARLLDSVLRRCRLLYLTFVREHMLQQLKHKHIIAARTLVYVESPIDVYPQLRLLEEHGIDVHRVGKPALSCKYEDRDYFEDKVYTNVVYVIEDYPHSLDLPLVHRLLQEPYVRAVRLCLQYAPQEVHKLEQLAHQLSSRVETSRDYEDILDILADVVSGHVLVKLTTCIVVSARDLVEHELRWRAIEAKLQELGLKVSQVTGHPYCALYDMPRLGRDVLTSTRYVTELASPVALELVEEDGVYFTDLDLPDLSIPIILNPFATHALVKHGRRSYRAVQHILIVGMSGAGKSGLGVVLAYRAKKHQEANLLILDVKGRDYAKLASRLGIETVRPCGLDPVRLWSPRLLDVDPTSAGLAVAGTLATLLDIQDRHLVNKIASEIANHYRTSSEHSLAKLISEIQDSKVRELLQELYETYQDYVAGDLPELEQDVVISFDKIPDIGDPSRIENPKTTSLILALPLVLHYALRIRNIAYAVLDEAWRLLKLAHTQHMLELMFRTFRSMNIAVVFITQDFEDLHDSPVGHVLLNNSDIHVIMKQRSRRSIELLRESYGIPDNLLRSLYPETEVGTGVLSTRGHVVPIRVRLLKEELKLLPD